MRRLAVVLVCLVACAPAGAARTGGTVGAIVTAETQDAVLLVDLSSGKVVQRLRVPAGPQTVATSTVEGRALVVSTTAGAVTLLATGPRLRILHVFRGFRAPHIALFHPSGDYAFVTDDAAGTLVVLRLARPRVVARLHVGAGAHHLALDTGSSELWVALGERARRIVRVDVSDPAHPRVVGSFDPGFAAHDIAFAPDARDVWVSSAQRTDVAVLDVVTHRVRFRVPVGAAPQHVVFFGRFAYVTSGYAGRIEQVDARTGRVLRSASTAVGSFNLATEGGYVLTASLLDGTLTELTDALHPVRALHLAPATRDVAGATLP
jgi:DNA-binding beta-propeller fold protein YncE